VDKKHVLIISEHPADFYSLTAALERAEPPRFKPVTVNTRDQPVDALMDPVNDAVILAYTLETEYLLRLAQKKHLTLPIIVLIDHESEAQVRKLKEAGATDYIVRGLISDDMLHRVLDYSMVLSHVTMQHEQVLKQQRIERAAQQAGEHLQSVAEAVADGSDHTVVMPGPTARPPGSPAKAPPAAQRIESGSDTARAAAPGTPRALARPWKTTIMVLAAGVILIIAALLSQRLENESRLSRLEASNDILSRQLTQIHSDMARTVRAPASETAAVEIIDPVKTSLVAPAPPTAATATETAEAPGSKPVWPVPVEAAPTTETVEPGITGLAQVSPEATDAPPTAPIPIAARDSEPVLAAPTELAELPGGPWFINLGTFSSQGAARRFARTLEPTSHQIEILPVRAGENDLYRVRLQGLPSEEIAEALATDYQITLGGGRPWVGRD
jgi:DNA-binding NarL/FixJ family response regulator